MEEGNFHDILKQSIHEYILLTYGHTKKYDPDERFSLIS